MRSLFIGALLLSSSLALAGTWEIDPEHSRAGFSVKHLAITNVTGQLGPVTGAIELDDGDVTKSKVTASVDVAGINTGVEKRDKHLRSPDFFEAARFPAVTFTSAKVEKAGDGLKVTGNLTMHGVTRPITLDVELSPEVMHPFTKKPARAVTATGKLTRQDFGLTWNLPGNALWVGSEVKVTIELEVHRKDAK